MAYRENNYILLKKTGVNLKSPGAQLLFPSYIKRMISIKVTMIIEQATSVTGTPTFSVGTNASSYNNILGSSSTSGVNSVNAFRTFTAESQIISPSTNIYLNITVEGISTGAFTATFLLEGYFLP